MNELLYYSNDKGGSLVILGVDEVGRGPLAGPLVVGAVVLGGSKIDGLTDSKKLSRKQREALDIVIRKKAKGIGLGWVAAEEIDEIGLSKALALATRLAVEQIRVPFNEIIIDGKVNFLSGTHQADLVTTLVKADLLVPSVSAASIVAKVARDNYMIEQSKLFPGYDFDKHVGYGTAAHKAAIRKSGMIELHRRSFLSVRKPEKVQTAGRKLTSKQIGDSAEDAASTHLTGLGHEILDRNWKTKYCEIDIVSRLRETVYFTEVKYRKRPDQGGGLAAITSKKLHKMKFAAELYASSKQISDVDLCLAVISSAGQPPVVESFLEIQ